LSSTITNEGGQSIWTQVGFKGVRESGSYLAETQDDIQWILQSYGLDFQDNVEQLLYEFDSEFYFW